MIRFGEGTKLIAPNFLKTTSAFEPLNDSHYDHEEIETLECITKNAGA
jgi:hypothetical protein